MNRKLILAAVLAATISGNAHASQEQMADEIFSHQRSIDTDNRATDTNTRTLMAGCTITQALISALSGDTAKFKASLENAGGNLAKSAEGLRYLAGKKLFQKPVNVSGLKLSSALSNDSLISGVVVVSPDRTMTGDGILLAIAGLAEQSGSIISRMREGKPNNEDLTTLIQNNGDIAQLILAFYGLLTQKAKG